MPQEVPSTKGFWLPPHVVIWIILLLLAISLWPNAPLTFTHLSLYLVVLLFIASLFPHLRRLSLRVPGGAIDWEKEVKEVSVMLKTSLGETEETGAGTDLQNLLFACWCRGVLSRWLLFLYHHLHEEGELDHSKARILCTLIRDVSKKLPHSQT